MTIHQYRYRESNAGLPDFNVWGTWTDITDSSVLEKICMCIHMNLPYELRVKPSKPSTEEEIVDAAIEYVYCPARGSYKDGQSIEDLYARLVATVSKHTGVYNLPESDTILSLAELKKLLSDTLSASESKR